MTNVFSKSSIHIVYIWNFSFLKPVCLLCQSMVYHVAMHASIHVLNRKHAASFRWSVGGVISSEHGHEPEERSRKGQREVWASIIKLAEETPRKHFPLRSGLPLV